MPHHVENATELGPADLGPPDSSALLPLPTLRGEGDSWACGEGE